MLLVFRLRPVFDPLGSSAAARSAVPKASA